MLLQSKSYAFPSERENYRNMKAILKENEGFSFREWAVRWKKTKKQKERECSDSLSFCLVYNKAPPNLPKGRNFR